MSLFRRKGPYDIDNAGLNRVPRRAERQERAPLTAEQMKRVRKTTLLLISNTLLSLLVYFGCIALDFQAIMLIYIGLAAVLLIGYVVYNQGFALKGVTPDMLSDTYTPEQKQQMIEQAQHRYEGSRWMMTLIIPLLIAVMLDAIYLFLLQDLLLSLGIEL